MSSNKLHSQVPAVSKTGVGLLCLALLLVGLLTGCSSVASLPTLSESESVRDAIARSEKAILIRTSELASLATECDTCQIALNEQAEAAAERLQTMGGMWEPWSSTETDAETESETGAEPETVSSSSSVSVSIQDGVAIFTDESGQTSRAEIPDDLGEAPYTPAGLAAYMYATSIEQLQAASEVSEIEAAQLTTYGSILAGRISAAFELAAAYGVDLLQAVQELPEEATATAVTEEMRSELVQALTEAAQAESESTDSTETDSGNEASDAASDSTSADSGTGSSTSTTSETNSSGEITLPDTAELDLSEEDTQLIAEVLLQLDCVAGSFQQAVEGGVSSSAVSSLVILVQQRASFWVDAGVSDLRNLRCEANSTDASELANQVIALDLQLFASEDTQVRLVGANYLAQDVEILSDLGEVNLVSPGVS